MRDIDSAKMLLGLARKDLATMLAVRNISEVGNEVFGFHAQQAVEKALKAWLSVLGIPYPFTHSLGALLGLVEDEAGAEEVSPFRNLKFLGAFAVQFRYITYDDTEGELDKDGIVSDVDKLLQHVNTVIGEKQ
jgi:HEPN domain-containing protein